MAETEAENEAYLGMETKEYFLSDLIFILPALSHLFFIVYRFVSYFFSKSGKRNTSKQLCPFAEGATGDG